MHTKKQQPEIRLLGLQANKGANSPNLHDTTPYRSQKILM